MAASTTLGVSIQRTPFSETSQIVHFLTRDFGRVTCIAKGAFREKNSFEGNIDLMVMSRIGFARRKGRSMALLRSRELLNHYPGLHDDLRAFSLAALMGELMRSGVQEGQVIPGLFSLLARSLDALDEGRPSGDFVALAFQGALLKMLGYEPELDRCVECRARPATNSLLCAYPSHGGIVCRNCPKASHEGYTLSWNASRFIKGWGNTDPLSMDPSGLSPKISRELWAFFEGFFQYFLEKRINAYAFIKGLERVS